MGKRHITINQTLFFIILLLPFLDILSSITADSALSIGAVVRTLFMVVLLTYLVYQLFIHDRRQLWFMVVIFSCIFLTFIINWGVKVPFQFFSEVQFHLKSAYFISMLFAVLVLFRKQISRTTLLHATKIVALIVGLSYWVAVLTNTNIKSYAYVKQGYAGWFFSANELSVIVIVLLTCSILLLIENASLSSFVSFCFMLSIMPMIGTKTAFYGGVIIVICYLFYVLFTTRKKWDIPILAVSLLFIMALPMTPIMSNSTADPTLEQIEQTKASTQMLSSRDTYLKTTIQDYKKAALSRKLFGLGYAGDYNKAPKTIEMDFYDLFFSYGIIGTILFLVPLIAIANKIIVIRKSMAYFTLFLTLGLCSGISFVAGHVIFAPAVMSYVAILLLLTRLEAKAI